MQLTQQPLPLLGQLLQPALQLAGLCFQTGNLACTLTQLLSLSMQTSADVRGSNVITTVSRSRVKPAAFCLMPLGAEATQGLCAYLSCLPSLMHPW